MFGSHVGNEKVVDLQNEVRPGGSYNYHITRNGKEFLQDGEYLKIDRPKRLSFTWREAAKKNAHKSKISLSLDTQDGKTKLRLAGQVSKQKNIFQKSTLEPSINSSTNANRRLRFIKANDSFNFHIHDDVDMKTK